MKQKLKATPLMMILFRDVDLLEHDAASQYTFNKRLAVFFFIWMVIIPFVPSFYQHSVGTLIIEELSLWALVATHFSGMSGALAAKNTGSTVAQVASNVDDIQDDVSKIADVVAG
jgi:hypothetical protein